MALLGLPTEVLQDIVQHAVPEGFESILLTCKLLNDIGTPYLDEYNTNKRKWSTIDIPRDWDSDVKIVGDLLLHVSESPIIGRYIKHARFGIRYGDDGPVRTEVRFNDALDRLWEHLGGDMQTGLPEEEVKTYRFLRAVISLLTFLPNVEELHLPSRWRDFNVHTLKDDDDKNSTSQDIWYVLDKLVVDCNSHETARKPLASLQRLCYTMPGGSDEYHGFRDFVPFLAMPQIKELYTSSCKLVKDLTTGIPFGTWRYPNYQSGLRRIELANCCMDATISQFLSHVPSLQIFRYSHQVKWHGCEYEWSAGEFVAAVASCCGDTLTDLAITIEGHIGSIVTGVTSLHQFTKLEHLQLDMRVFLGPSIESDERISHLHKPEQIKWKLEHVPPLTRTLPRTTQTLILNGLRDDDRRPAVCGHLFHGFDTDKTTALPSLQSVAVEQHVIGFPKEGLLPGEAVARLCEKLDVDCLRLGSEHASWRRLFGSRFPIVDRGCDDCRVMHIMHWIPPRAEREVAMSKYCSE